MWNGGSKEKASVLCGSASSFHWKLVFSPRCIYSEVMRNKFYQLSERYHEAVFLKVDMDTCEVHPVHIEQLVNHSYRPVLRIVLLLNSHCVIVSILIVG